MTCCVSQGALAERQQLIPELVRNGDEENPLKVRSSPGFKDRVSLTRSEAGSRLR